MQTSSQAKQTRYQPKQFTAVLDRLKRQQVSGIVHITANLDVTKSLRSRILVLRNGNPVYAGIAIPENVAFVRAVATKLDRRLVETAIKFAAPKLTNPKSIRELLEIIVRLRTLSWIEIEKLVLDQVAQTIEQLLLHAGQIHLEQGTQQDLDFDLTHNESGQGLDWSQLKLRIQQRQQIWQTLAPLIPSMDEIPRLPANGLARGLDELVRKQLVEQVNGKMSIVEIAEQLDRDPLELAKAYYKWVENGWITCQSLPIQSANQLINQSVTTDSGSKPIDLPIAIANKNRHLILVVDDSMIVQTTMKRILADHYEVILASNAMVALNILTTNQVSVMLLDVTMPDIDGLEFCRTLRKMPKFRNLPIIMLTAKDTLVDKFQGFIAGSNQYLCKPVDSVKLLEFIASYTKP